jgi:hypothetical protein
MSTMGRKPELGLNRRRKNKRHHGDDGPVFAVVALDVKVSDERRGPALELNGRNAHRLSPDSLVKTWAST